MKKIIVIVCATILIISCKNHNGAVLVGLHEVVAKEFLQTNAYTYVRASESGKDVWIAIPKTDIKVGTTYYFQGGMAIFFVSPVQSFDRGSQSIPGLPSAVYGNIQFPIREWY